jgi:Na+/melibiose symporter-like transporter
MPISTVLGADIIDYVEYKLDHRSEPAVASISSFVSKAGNGVGGAIPGFVLGLVGYVAGGAQQSASVINSIKILSIGVPILFFVAAALVFGLAYKLDKKLLQEVEDALSERRAAKLAKSK